MSENGNEVVKPKRTGGNRGGGRKKGCQDAHIAAIDPADITRLVGEGKTLAQISFELNVSRRWLYDNPAFHAAKVEGRKVFQDSIRARQIALMNQNDDLKVAAKMAIWLGKMICGQVERREKKVDGAVHVTIEYVELQNKSAETSRFAAIRN